MSEHTLPDDLSQWPDDPYQLLGLKPGADERAIKKAYTRLIRQFKPEQAPNHFRRIRDAYEQAKRWLQWNRPASVEDGDASGSPVVSFDPNNFDPGELLAAFNSKANNGHETTADAGGTHPRQQPVEVAQLREACQKARNGEIAAAYEALRALIDSPVCDDEDYARLYWLLRLWPQLEPGRSACHWLVQGMMARGLSGWLCELYCEYLELDPAEAFTERCTRLLTHRGTPWSRLNLVRARWTAAALQNRWHYVGEDLDRLHGQYEDAYQAWARVLLAACEVLAWSSDPAAIALGQRCRLELEQHFSQDIELHDELDRLDLLDEMVSSCARLQQAHVVPPDLIALLRDSWLLPYHRLRYRLQSVLMPLVASPPEALWLLDFIHNISPVAVIRLGDMIEWLLGQGDWEEQSPTAEQQESLSRWLRSASIRHSKLRVSLLTWCTVEAISPRQVVEMLHTQTSSIALDDLAQDSPLHYAWMAYTAMWT